MYFKYMSVKLGGICSKYVASKHDLHVFAILSFSLFMFIDTYESN